MTLDVTIGSPDYAIRQAASTAEQYLLDAISSIDKHLGDGYAKRHPELIAAFMRSAAQDFHSTLLKAAAQDLRDVLAPADNGGALIGALRRTIQREAVQEDIDWLNDCVDK